MAWTQIAIELVVGFVLLFAVTRILGKKQLSQITPFDFISALVLGELVGNAIYDDKVDSTSIIMGVGIWGALIFIVQMIEMKSLKLRGKMVGKPSIVISRGKLDREEMKKGKLNIDELQNMLRAKDVFSIGEVEYAIFETNGTVSVLRKPQYDTPTRQDLNLKNQAVNLPFTIIADGRLLEKNLKDSGHNLHWLNNELKKHGGHGIKDIYFAEWTEGSGWVIQPYA
jgi:uncharacterized membrane protein YcaP (DUF421 family)